MVFVSRQISIFSLAIFDSVFVKFMYEKAIYERYFVLKLFIIFHKIENYSIDVRGQLEHSRRHADTSSLVFFNGFSNNW